jgi:DNA (cytosine-5)-methyltransferase 1
VGIKKELLKDIELNKSLNGSWFPWSQGKYSIEQLANLKWPAPQSFGNTPIKPVDIPYELCIDSILIRENEKDLPNAEERFNLYGNEQSLRQIKEGETNRPSFKRPHRYKYSPTACYGNNEVHLHPFKHARLSVRETLRIQGVPDEYVLPPELPLTKKFKMIGNGVPVPMAYAVAQSLLQYIKDKKLHSKRINGHLVKR